MYLDEVNKTFIGARYSNNQQDGKCRVTRVPFQCFANSGAGAIATAHAGGASKIILLGYDCQFTNGKSHWHGDHPKQLGNAGKINLWHKKFEELAKHTHGTTIVNASRQTALEVFERVNLEDVL